MGLVTWPANRIAVQVATLVLVTIVFAMLLVGLADGGFGAGVEVLSGR